MNNLEKSIIDAAKKAHTFYASMSGSWLFHAPESFFMSIVGHHVHKSYGVKVFWMHPLRKFMKRWAHHVEDALKKILEIDLTW